MSQAKIFTHSELEQHPFYIRAARVFTVPLLNLIPSAILQRLVRRSNYGKRVIDKPGTTHSLETMYTKEKSKLRQTSVADSFWHNFVSQPKAVRNRLRIVEMLLEDEVLRRARDLQNHIRIYNIGGGSSRAIVRTAAKMRQERDIRVEVSTIDRDSTALELGSRISSENGVADLFTWIQGDARDLDKLVGENSADIVEMVGLLDYFDHAGSVALIKKIHDCLKPGGLFLVANVHPNPESKFVERVGWPKMYYKTTEELTSILSESGFHDEELSLHIEPLMVHLIGVARKK